MRALQCLVITALLFSLVAVPNAHAQFPNVDKMTEPQLINLFNQYIAQTVRPRELAVRKRENILNHKVLAVKKLSKEVSAQVIDSQNFARLGKDSLVFYVAVNYQLKEESKYRLNGINYRLITMLKEPNGTWSFFQYENAPVHILVGLNQGFNTEDEKQMAEISKLHYQGIYKNRAGQQLGDFNTDNVASEQDLIYEMTGKSQEASYMADDEIPGTVNPYYKRPKWIRVLMTHPSNLQYYGCTKACVQRIDFMDYLKHVLPLEWIKEAPPESLKAGALAVKMYAWHAVSVDPKARYTDADIVDTTQNQVYAADFKAYYKQEIRKNHPGISQQQLERVSEQESNIAEKTAAMLHAQGVAGIGLKENVLHTLIDVGHKKEGKKASGIVSQTGATRMANEGKSHIQILRYYVEGAPTLPRGTRVELFRYTK
ncbi:SpoIID/LytB domain-containing protein [Paenibacillus sp. MMS18-CY102]|uniref:SpoIID/LytB domain-containing protein n=1 Tax=Paenibacillus sp. MMS18-CY102 TaxID=2682849 RepID=UPI001365FE45|nr:SpoIID/LytB domain-containing protein [Paenibacillus sp. MMS18-CY102]MWC30499.1 hypothetical protein [Paenibacillus sp. MMS18-CY102]